MDIHRVYGLTSRRFRKQRMARFEATFPLDSETRILDVGGTPYNWQFVQARPHVTLLNLALPTGATTLPPHMRAIVGDGTAIEFPDDAFDIVFSNSVIEHLGDQARQQRFAAEVRRVGRGLWTQTPARSFPIEPHYMTPFIHYLPRAVRRRLIRNGTLWGWMVRPSPRQVEKRLNELRLLSHDDMASFFPDCTLITERLAGLAKSYVAVRAIGA